MKKADRQKVYDKCGGKCAYCGWVLDDTWQVDHAVSKCHWMLYDPTDPKKVNDMNNLLPACQVCNRYKRSHCIEDGFYHIGFRTYMLKFHIRLGRLPKKTRKEKTAKTKAYMQAIADRFGITPDNPFSGKFYFELLEAGDQK